ncbi:MAG TPA: outer membrane protein assembly factor BamE [Gammaproteobacteria bacterium]|nr:outer membrane protein assembly factor BamE [Gammaproteobacteria bacterium]
MGNMRRFILLSVILSSLLLAACSVHKIDIQQGNVITWEMVETLTLGMDKRRVQLAIGSPMIQDPFHPDRWDYVYSFKAGMRDEEQSAHIILYFDGDTLQKVDVVKAPPSEKDVLKPTLRGQGG